MSLKVVNTPLTEESIFGADPSVDRPERPSVSDRSGSASAPRDKPIDASMAKSEIARACSLLYNLSHRLLKVDKRYRAQDFGEEADGLYDLVGAHSELRIILRLAAPLAALGALWEKVEDTLDILRKRREAKAPAATATASQDDGVDAKRSSGRAPLAPRG